METNVLNEFIDGEMSSPVEDAEAKLSSIMESEGRASTYVLALSNKELLHGKALTQTDKLILTGGSMQRKALKAGAALLRRVAQEGKLPQEIMKERNEQADALGIVDN